MDFTSLDPFTSCWHSTSDQKRFWETNSEFQQSKDWLRHSTATGWLVKPINSEKAIEAGARCGHVALAAVLGADTLQLLGLFAPLEEKAWVSRRDMERTLREKEVPFDKLTGKFPEMGISLIRITHKDQELRHHAQTLFNTHWVAVAGVYVYDLNCNEWLPMSTWEDAMRLEWQRRKGGEGNYSILTSYEIPRQFIMTA